VTIPSGLPKSGAPLPPPVRKGDKKPTGLPVVNSHRAAHQENQIPNVRFCKKCREEGRGEVEGRVVSNSLGVNVYCRCGYQWPISSAALAPAMPDTMPRGLRKETWVEPDWNLAFEDLGDRNDKVGPKKSG
jgi:hypothetical protein